MSARPPTKKLKRNKRPAGPAAQTTLPTARASLTTLPIEILAEVLLYTSSPPTVLAVSRTCSFLYRTLVNNPAASFIWRGVRNTCKPLPLPDLSDLWDKSEAEYAAFVFGGGVCEVCRRGTRIVYVSFALRARLCGSWHCRRKFLKELLVDVSDTYPPMEHRQSLWVPFVESNLCFHPNHMASTWPNITTVLVRKSDLEKFELDSVVYGTTEQAGTGLLSGEDEEKERTIRRCNVAVQRFPMIMELSVRLTKWKVEYDREYESIKKVNQVWTADLAEREGWNREDLLASRAYGSMQKRKTFLLEKISVDDVSSIQSSVESELLEIKARRERQKSEAAYRDKMTEVKKIYERMRCGTLKGATSDSSGPLVVPPLSVFFNLSSVRLLMGSPDPSAAPPDSNNSSEIKSSPLATSLIISDIHTWLIPVRAHLTRLLGYPNGWQSVSSRTVPPIKRVTARFFCRRCGEGRVGRGYRRQQCLDFKGVCSHVCVAAQKQSIEGTQQEALQEDEIGVPNDDNRSRKKKGGKKKGRAKTEWKVDLFKKDEKAIRVIKTILELTGLSEEDSSTASSLNEKGAVIRCITCEGWVVMDFDTAIGHAHRHDTMKIELLVHSIPWSDIFLRIDASASHVTFSELYAFERGITELLLGPSHRGRNLCNKVNYGCKHCFGVTKRANDDEIAISTISSSLRLGVKSAGTRAMNFNALRSHVKGKHGIQDIGDEDFFCYSPVNE